MVQLTKLSNSAYHTACTQFYTKRLIEIEFRINDVKLSFVLERKLNVTSFALAVCVCYLYELDPSKPKNAHTDISKFKLVEQHTTTKDTDIGHIHKSIYANSQMRILFNGFTFYLL